MLTRRRVREWLEERFFVRIHMTLILLGTTLAGVVATRTLMRLHVNVLALRYAIAVTLAYLVFLGLVKLWLLYVHTDAEPDAMDVLDLAADAEIELPAVSSSGSGFSMPVDLDVDLGDDLTGIVFLIALILIVFLLGGIAIYYIAMAPAVLGEAAFEALLAASLARRAKKAEGAGWLRAVSRATVLPFVIVLAFSIFLGWIAQKHCPDAIKLRDAMSCASGTSES